MFFFKQKTAYEMRISDWSSDVCSSDLVAMSLEICRSALVIEIGKLSVADFLEVSEPGDTIGPMVIISTFTTTGRCPTKPLFRSEEHTSELQSLMRISYAVFCLKKSTTHLRRTIH